MKKRFATRLKHTSEPDAQARGSLKALVQPLACASGSRCLKLALSLAALLLVVNSIHAESKLPKIAALLEAGERPVKIVCIGDSITGVYYHTGGRRAYPEMV